MGFETSSRIRRFYGNNLKIQEGERIEQENLSSKSRVSRINDRSIFLDNIQKSKNKSHRKYFSRMTSIDPRFRGAGISFNYETQFNSKSASKSNLSTFIQLKNCQGNSRIIAKKVEDGGGNQETGIQTQRGKGNSMSVTNLHNYSKQQGQGQGGNNSGRRVLISSNCKIKKYENNTSNCIVKAPLYKLRLASDTQLHSQQKKKVNAYYQIKKSKTQYFIQEESYLDKRMTSKIFDFILVRKQQEMSKKKGVRGVNSIKKQKEKRENISDNLKFLKRHFPKNQKIGGDGKQKLRAQYQKLRSKSNKRQVHSSTNRLLDKIEQKQRQKNQL